MCKSPSKLDSRVARKSRPVSSTTRSNTGSNTAKITRASKRKSFGGKTPRAEVVFPAGAKAINRTPGPRWRSGSDSREWKLYRFGVVRVVGGKRDIFLDFDHHRIPRLYPLWRLCRLVGVVPVFIESFRTRKGWHVWIKLRESLTNAERVAFQACAGSDVRREELNLMRVVAIRRSDPGSFWRNRWNLLFTFKLR